MKFRAALLASLFTLTASTAMAAVTYTATTSVNGTPAGSNNVNVTPGDTVEISIQLVSDGTAVFGIGASATGYDTSIVSFTSGQSAAAVLVQVCIPGTGCFGGIDNAATTPFQSTSNPAGAQVRFVNGVSTNGTSQTGANDWAPGTETPGPQFELVFTAGTTEGTTTITLDALSNFGDATLGSGGATLVTNGDSVTVTVPEPMAAASSLAALLSVLGVATLRRRS